MVYLEQLSEVMKWMEPKKHKKKTHYTMMIVSDSLEGDGNPFCMNARLALGIVLFFCVAVFAAGGYLLYRSSQTEGNVEAQTALQEKIEKLTEENTALMAEKEELSEKITILSETVTEQKRSEAEAEAAAEEEHLPKGFPLAGPAVILESSEMAASGANEEAEAEDGREDADEAAVIEGEEDAGEVTAQEKPPIVVFSASVGTQVVASGSGTVYSVEADEEYGYQVVVDHENGYHSIYRDVSLPRVEKGDAVKRGQVLYEMQTEGERMGYQLQKDDVYIDPLELMELYG